MAARRALAVTLRRGYRVPLVTADAGGEVRTVSEAGTAPIFVVGSMRSGSTLLRLILDSHPDIASPGETGFMGGLRAVKEVPGWKSGRGWYERVGWTEPELDVRLHDFYAGIFERFARQEGKSRWAEKTPFHTEHVQEMAQVFPEALFVGIVRHPGGVATSLCRRFHYGFDEAVSYWGATNTRMVEGARAVGDRFALLRYEDLVRHGEAVLHELVQFLGAPWSPSMLNHHEVQPEKGAPRAVEGSTVTTDPIDAGRADHWWSDISIEDRRSLDRVAELAACFGYSVEEPIVRGLPRSRGDQRWLRRGGKLELPPTPATAVAHDNAVLMAQGDPVELARRLLKVEQALARARSRRAVRFADAVRTVQHGRSLHDLRKAYAMVRGADGGATASR